jgi:hypothetical protein
MQLFDMVNRFATGDCFVKRPGNAEILITNAQEPTNERTEEVNL